MEVRSRRIYINAYDLERLKMLLRTQGDLGRPENASLQALAADLNRVSVVKPGDEVPLVVTMNTRFRLTDLDTSEEGEYTLVFPGKSAKGNGKISVLTPAGAALIGAHEFETIVVPVPGGTRLRVESILYQPEAAGEYQL